MGGGDSTKESRPLQEGEGELLLLLLFFVFFLLLGEECRLAKEEEDFGVEAAEAAAGDFAFFDVDVGCEFLFNVVLTSSFPRFLNARVV